MATSSIPFAEVVDLAENKPDDGTVALDDAGIGLSGTVLTLDLETQLAAWLRAVGIGEGDRVQVLRAGAFGGPLHVRNASGGELAINRQLARSIRVKLQG